MQLNDILEENSIQAISAKTKIPEENLEYLIASEFDALTKVKTLGFISILEREYKADLSVLRASAEEYYGQSVEAHLFPIGQPIADEHKSKPKLLILFILLLLGVSSWYFFTQFDKKNLNELIPFIDEETIESFMGNKEVIIDENITLKSDHLKIEEKSVAQTLRPEISESKNIVEENASHSVEEDNSTAEVSTPSSVNSTVEDTEV
ncbi:MAG TPA: hypothetical protein EYH57_00765 [Sulfurovum sp.]|nr:hypothetical protein [Sulfurovum sp.]